MPAMLPLLALSLLASAPQAAAPVKTASELFQQVRGCVYEVVIPKLRDSTTTYAERLPLEKLSFQERTDSVWSIGSAFAIGRDTVLTAAHVLELGENLPDREPMLRNSDGKLFRIGKFLKFSNHQDFAILTVPGLGAKSPLRPAKSPQVGQAVHAVGNALGEGIVLRNGLLTSQTPEEFNGEWKYWRFSAAASPGNSGGPLLDERGALVGVVLMKSQSENLNYALPWSVVKDFPTGKARYHERSTFVYPSLPDAELMTTLDTTLAIPGSWRELDHLVWKLSGWKTSRDRDSVLRAQHDQLFPRGLTGRLTVAPLFSGIPATIYRGEGGWWSLDVQETRDPVDLGQNGTWTQNKEGAYIFATAKVPDSLKPLEVLDDSKAMGDLLLKGVRLERDIAGKDIRVVSLGKAVIDSLRTDRWGRPWIVRGWRKPWDGGILLAQVLPLPNGFSMILGIFSEGAARSHSGARLQDFADNSTMPMLGTTRQWMDLLARTDLVAPFLRDIRFQDPDKQASVSVQGGKLRLPSALLDPEQTPVFLMTPGFARNGKDSLVYGIGTIALSPGYTSGSFAVLMRVGEPAKDLPAEAHADWRKRVELRSPYDGRSIDVGGNKRRVEKALGTARPDGTLWMAVVLAENAPSDSRMAKIFSEFLRDAKAPSANP